MIASPNETLVFFLRPSFIGIKIEIWMWFYNFFPSHAHPKVMDFREEEAPLVGEYLAAVEGGDILEMFVHRLSSPSGFPCLRRGVNTG